MGVNLNLYKHAQLAEAAYANFINPDTGAIFATDASIQAALIASGFSINQNNPTQSIQATAFITQWRVIDQYTAPFSAGLFGTGFSGTLQRKVPESISFQP
jgi:hypothetical protein